LKHEDIEVGGTYLLVTDNLTRRYLSGHPFTVKERRKVWRAQTTGLRIKVWRYYNEDAVAVRADELQELPERELPCTECPIGEYEQHGFTSPSGQTNYKCNNCGHIVSFP
jgi:hypothetical protein